MDEIKIEPVEFDDCCGKDECEDCPLDKLDDVALAPVIEKAVAEKKPVAPKTYTAKDGDTWAALGKKFAPKGVSGFEHAKHLMALNGGKPLAAGVEVAL